jgi:2-amino-4-hydroxy-6-hydroxymethyldihydropteridine diphosphokinase
MSVALLVALGLGSNLAPTGEPPFDAPASADPRQRALEGALILLRAAGLRIVRTSRPHDTDPAGVDAPQPAYLNACVLALASGAAGHEVATLEGLLQACEAIEARAGTRRKGSAGPRPLDIDILAAWGPAAGVGGRPLALPPLSAEGLQVPHPRLTQRAFVLVPLCEVAADLEVAADGQARSVGRLLADLGEGARSGVRAAPSSPSFPWRDTAIDPMDLPPADCYPAPGAHPG